MTDPTVCLTFDFDAVSPWLHIDDGRNTPTNRSRGLFGAKEGAPRLLDLLADEGIDATWFTPGHTIDSFPDVAERVVEDGHEIGHHGWSHTPPGAYDDRESERADIERGIERIRSLTGEEPAGYRSPSWDYSEHTVALLDEFGFTYSSSGMASDFQPYRVHTDSAPADAAYDYGAASDLLELPVSWQRDDYPGMAFLPDRGLADEAAVVERWRRGFDWMADNEPDGVFVLTMHPQVMGRAHRLDRLRDLIDHFRERDATFETCRSVAERYTESAE
ncbi:MAG: polysaccharide deacetylase [Halobaculum sp.]